MNKPIPTIWLTRIIWIALIILLIYVGYLNELYQQQTKQYLRLEDKYVRVRNQLGFEEMQRLIDNSYLPANN